MKILELSGDAPSADGGSLAYSEPSRAAAEATLTAVLGLEDYPSIAASFSPADAAVQYLRRNEIQAVLRRNHGERSTHLEGHGAAVGFLELVRRPLLFLCTHLSTSNNTTQNAHIISYISHAHTSWKVGCEFGEMRA